MPAMRATPETLGINTAFGRFDEIIPRLTLLVLATHFVTIKPTDRIGISRFESIPIKFGDLTRSHYFSGGRV
jgi:hypothetical protein